MNPKKHLRRTLIIGSIVILVLLALFVIYHKKQRANWIQAKVGTVVNAIYGLGTVHSDETFTLRVGVTKYINTIFVKVGQNVKKGDILMVDENHHTVKAPFSGTITAKPYSSFETATPQATILTLTNLQARYLEVSLDQDSFLQLNKAKRVKVNFEALPKQTFTGTIVYRYASEQNFYLRVNVNHLPNTILPGMTADVAILTDSSGPVVQIPLTAIHAGKVTFRDANQIKTVTVTIGTRAKGWGAVTSNNIPRNALIKVTA